MFKEEFFGKQAVSAEAYRQAMHHAVEVLQESLPSGSYSGGAPGELAKSLPEWREGGGSLAEALEDLRQVVGGAVAVYEPSTCAHLHCPVVIAALCAEVVISALNPSMDSFDQSGAATLIEQQVCEWVARLVGHEQGAAVTFTSGGTQSNYMGLLLARDKYIQKRWGWSVREDGIPAQAAGKLRVLCSEVAHFSVTKSAHQLGLGTSAVVAVPVGMDARMDLRAWQSVLALERAAGHEVFAVVATGGTTDAGAFDPVEELAHLCAVEGIWLHVDAAWGSAVLVSALHRHKLAGVAMADSVTLDFHKGFYQPVSCSAFLVRDAADFAFIRHHADYLNPEGHEASGIPDLVTHSLLTTRRFDALKLWMTLRTVGVGGLGAMVDATLALAAEVAADMREASSDFVLCCEPEFSAVLFRLKARTGDSEDQMDALHDALPPRMQYAGRGIVGFTKWKGRSCLKLTLLNPNTQRNDVRQLLAKLVETAEEWRAEELEALI